MVFRQKVNSRKRKLKAQATIEFAFTFIVLVFIFYSCVKVLQWMGVALVSSTGSHYEGLYSYQYTYVPEPGANVAEQLKSAESKALPDLKITQNKLLFQ